MNSEESKRSWTDWSVEEKKRHVFALFGFFWHEEEHRRSVEKLRAIAADYSDAELVRFAHLLARYDRPAGENRERSTAGVSDREGALAEIALTIDTSWMVSEAEDEIYFDEVRNGIIRSYPNPTREGCPSESALREIVMREMSESTDADMKALLHAYHCGPCMRLVVAFIKERKLLESAA